jgi:hypothetical protein
MKSKIPNALLVILITYTTLLSVHIGTNLDTEFLMDSFIPTDEESLRKVFVFHAIL